MFRLLRSSFPKSILSLNRAFSSASSVPHLNTQNVYHLSRGVVVRSLPKTTSQEALVSSLKSTFNPASIDLKLDIGGVPSYAVLRYEDEDSVKSALKLHKSLIADKPVYVCSINEFIALSPTIGSGHDSRKLIMFDLPSEWTEKDIHKYFSPIGSVMSCDLPRNYEKGSIIVDDHTLYNKIIGPQKLDLSKISFKGQTAANLFQDFRAYTHQELGYLRHLIAYKGNNSGQVFKKVQDLWVKVRKFKDNFGEGESADEVKINERLNKLCGLKSDSSLKQELESLIGDIKKEFDRTIDNYFPTRGFARVEFATREQAERAINFAVSLTARGLSVQAIFDRGLPDYMFDAEIIGEAYLRESKFKPGETDKEVAAKTGHHYARMTQEMIKNYSLKPILNHSEYSDPLVSQAAKTKAEAKDVIASIEGNQPFGFNKRQKKMSKFQMNSKVYKFSSDDEYYSEIPPENPYSAFERLHDERHEYTKMLNEEFMMFPDKMPKRKEDVQTYQIVPDVEFPLEMIPTRLGVNPGEKVKAYETILSYQEFFHDKIPRLLKKNPEALQKEKFADYPNIRYVYQPADSYNDLNKKFKSAYKRQEVIQNVRKRIRSLPEPEEIAPNHLRYVELGEEERTIRLSYNTQRISTDSEYEDEIENNSKDLDFKKVIDQLNIEKKKFSQKLKLLDELGIPEYEQVVSKTFKYEGTEDIDEYIKELNKVPGNEAKWAENNEGEKIVYVGCKVEKPFDVEEARYLSEKYGDLIINSKDEEIEIDPEDVEKMERMKRFIMNPDQIFELLLHDAAHKDFEEKFSDFTSVEPIHEYGHMVQQAQEYLDSLNFDKMIEMYSDLFNDNEDARNEEESDDQNESSQESDESEDSDDEIDTEEKLDFEKKLNIENEDFLLELIDSEDSDDIPDESEIARLKSQLKNSSSESPLNIENSDKSTK